MSKFSAAKAVSKIEYDLNPYVDSKGAIPEPSEEDVDTLLNSIKEVMGDDEVGDDPEEIRAALEKRDLKEILDGMTDAISVFCKGTPTKEDIETLPFRVKQAFFNYVVEEVTNPEKSGGASKDSRAGRRGA